MAGETTLAFRASSHSRVIRSMRDEMTMASTECVPGAVLRLTHWAVQPSQYPKRHLLSGDLLSPSSVLGVTIDTKDTLMGDVAEMPCPPPSFHSIDVIISILQVRKLRLRR